MPTTSHNVIYLCWHPVVILDHSTVDLFTHTFPNAANHSSFWQNEYVAKLKWKDCLNLSVYNCECMCKLNMDILRGMHALWTLSLRECTVFNLFLLRQTSVFILTMGITHMPVSWRQTIAFITGALRICGNILLCVCVYLCMLAQVCGRMWVNLQKANTRCLIANPCQPPLAVTHIANWTNPIGVSCAAKVHAQTFLTSSNLYNTLKYTCAFQVCPKLSIPNTMTFLLCDKGTASLQQWTGHRFGIYMKVKCVCARQISKFTSDLSLSPCYQVHSIFNLIGSPFVQDQGSPALRL